MHFFHTLQQGFKRSTDIGVENPALFGRYDMAPFLREQADTQSIFDQLDLMAHGGVCQTQFVGGIPYALVPCRRLKAFQSLQRWQLSKINLWMHRPSLPGLALRTG